MWREQNVVRPLTGLDLACRSDSLPRLAESPSRPHTSSHCPGHRLLSMDSSAVTVSRPPRVQLPLASHQDENASQPPTPVAASTPDPH